MTAFRLEPLTLDLLPLARMTQVQASAVQRVELSDPELCWDWRWAADKDGYAVVTRVCGGRSRKLRLGRVIVAVSESVAYADIAEACHRCDNPPCINPSHLWHGSSSDNTQDMLAKGRQGRFAQHGTISKFVNSHCRCVPCHTAWLVYERRRTGVLNPVGPHRSAEERERIRQLYLETGLTQKALASLVGIPHQTIAKWVLGLRPRQEV